MRSKFSPRKIPFPAFSAEHFKKIMNTTKMQQLYQLFIVPISIVIDKTDAIKKVTSKCRLEPFRRPNSVTTISICIVRKISHPNLTMFSGKCFQETKYIHFFFLDSVMCSHKRMCVYGRYAPDVYIYIFFNLMTDVRECRKGVVFFNVL